MEVDAIAARNSVLFMWATFPLLPDALEVVSSWGFKYKTAFVWDKMRHNLGNYHNASAELLIVATRGSCVPDLSERQPQVVALPAGKHSSKPQEFVELIDRMYSKGPRIELFARSTSKPSICEWMLWGNELTPQV